VTAESEAVIVLSFIGFMCWFILSTSTAWNRWDKQKSGWRDNPKPLTNIGKLMLVPGLATVHIFKVATKLMYKNSGGESE